LVFLELAPTQFFLSLIHTSFLEQNSPNSIIWNKNKYFPIRVFKNTWYLAFSSWLWFASLCL